MFKKTNAIIKKNLFVLLHSRFSALTLIIGPLALILLLNFGLGGAELKNVGVALYIQADEESGVKLIEMLKARSYNVIKIDTMEECRNSVLSSSSEVCLALIKRSVPSSDKNKINENTYDLETYLDYSKQNVVWRIADSIERMGEELSKEMRERKINFLKNNLEIYQIKVKEIIGRTDIILQNIQRVNENLPIIEQEIQKRELQIKNIEEDLDEAIRLSNEMENKIISSNQSEPLKIAVSKISETTKKAKYSLGLIKITKSENKTDQIYTSLNEIRKNLERAENEVSVFRAELEKIDKGLEQIRNANVEEALNPVKISHYPVSEESIGKGKERFEFIDYLFPSFIVIFIMFTSLIFSTLLVVRERNSNAYLRNIASKTNGLIFVGGIFLTIFILVIVQTIFIIFLGQYFLNLNILPELGKSITIIILTATCFIILGMSIGYLFKSQETSLATSLFIAIALLVFSSIISPLESLPPLAKKIASYSPLVVSEGAMNKILIFNSETKNIIPQIWLLIILSCIASTIMFIAYKIKKYTETTK
ncbi:hypothetical protein FJZ18_01855 [Candidatus Pacearchaeota archaeon]|nr:hypothetical protein [Candidatus Pacearchaeota archaeon]